MGDSADGEISLRPTSLRPAGAGGNPFSSFGKGAGFGIKSKQSTLTSSIFEDRPRKDGPRIKFSKEQLLSFMDLHTGCPTELVNREPEIVIQVEAEKATTRQVLQKVAEDSDDRDWRMRSDQADGDSAPDAAAASQQQDSRASAAAPAAAAAEPAAQEPSVRPQVVQQPRSTPMPAPQQQQQQQQQHQGAPGAGASAQEAPKIQKASDLGREAYKAGVATVTTTSNERGIRTVKGILNKLTPEKFDRLLQQLLEVITTAEVLQHTIALVFENAVAQPTFCAMYADLCVQLAQELPSFAPPADSDKPLSFRQILLNTCQDEFEGTEAIRQSLSTLVNPDERELAERKVKMRTLGNVRLIGELYKKDMVKDWIMISVMEDLLGRNSGSKQLPSEERLEAACEMLSTAGAKLSKSDKSETRRKFEDVFKLLGRLAEEKALPARIRFLIKDINDLKRCNWVPRREVFTAKKLDEIRGQAEAELGIISSSIAASLPSLPGVGPLPGLGGGAKAGGDAEFMLLPPLRGGEGEDYSFASKDRGGKLFSGTSALVGDYQPPPKQSSLAAATAPAASAPSSAAPAAAAPSRPAAAEGPLSEEDLQRKAESIFQEFANVGDKTEATTCVREIVSPENTPKIVQIAFQQIIDSVKPKDQDSLAELLLHLHAQGALTSDDLTAGLRHLTEQLEDLCLDVPKLPALLGSFIGAAAHSGAVPLTSLPALLEGESSAEPKRALFAVAMKTLKDKAGGTDEALAAACAAADFHAEPVLAADPVMDQGMASVADFLKEEGLSAVPL